MQRCRDPPGCTLARGELRTINIDEVQYRCDSGRKIAAAPVFAERLVLAVFDDADDVHGRAAAAFAQLAADRIDAAETAVRRAPC